MYLPFKSGPAAQMKRKSRPDTTRPSSPLLQVGLRCPNRRIIGHIIVRCEDLHFGFAWIDHENNVVDGDTGFGDIGWQDDLRKMTF